MTPSEEPWYEIEQIPQVSIKAFAKKHGLALRVTERRVPIEYNRRAPEDRFYAHFDHADEKVLIGSHGNGATVDEAIRDYATKISVKTLVVDAFDAQKRREIVVPRLYHEQEG